MAQMSEDSLYVRSTRERREGKKNSIGYYDFEKSIGEGNFAKVKSATHALTGAQVAIKIVDKGKISTAAAEKLVREVRILKSLNHPHIAKLYEVIDTPNEIFMIMEYAEGGELFDYLVSHGRMKEKEARKHFRQIVSAIDYCHTRRVIHRDLKAENLLLDLDLNAKIADFGFSNNFEDGVPLHTWCGSPPYAAPELFQGKEYFGPELDVWSLGVVLYVLVCGALPFDGSSLSAVRSRVLSGRFKVPFYMSADCENLIKKMLTVDSAQRISVQDILKDKWFNEGLEPLKPSGTTEIVVTEEQHLKILERMADIGIPYDRIEQALQNQAFDHVWATYHLIADQITPRLPIESSPQPSSHIVTKTEPVAATVSTPTDVQVTVKLPPAEAPIRNTSPPNADLPEKSKKIRRHTVNTGVDVNQVKKDMVSKKVARIDTASGGSGPTSPPESPIRTSPPSSPIYLTPENGVPSPIPSSEFNTPIPKKKKERRQRALSLSTQQRPASVHVSVPSPTTPTFSSTEEAASSNSSSGTLHPTSMANNNAPIVSSPLNPNSPTTPSRSLKFQAPPRRVSFKDKFKKTLGIPIPEKEAVEPQPVEPKTVRFHFSVSTTSSKPHKDIVAEIESVMSQYNVAFERDAFLFLARKGNVAFEIEVCKLPRLALSGLRIKRLAGDSWEYKNLCSDMISKMKL